MAASLKHRRTHNLLLISKLLGCRENVSPFTLIVDSLEQSGRSLLEEMIGRAKISGLRVVYVAFETLRKPSAVADFVYGGDLQINELQTTIMKALQSDRRNLLVLDTLHPLLSAPGFAMPSFLSSIMASTVSILALYHIDVPIPSTCQPSYSPSPLTLLRYLATSVLTLHSTAHVISRKQARDRGRPEPVFGLAEEAEGVLVGLGSNSGEGLVIEMEYRRKSGREVRDWFFLPLFERSKAPLIGAGAPQTTKGSVMLLEDYPNYSIPVSADGDATGNGEVDTTFNLELTERQRLDREGVVLPYFDAQRDGKPGEGGRILYEMGVEDDFDEEEDEI